MFENRRAADRVGGKGSLGMSRGLLPLDDAAPHNAKAT
jgi:hypothetical protein